MMPRGFGGSPRARLGAAQGHEALEAPRAAGPGQRTLGFGDRLISEHLSGVLEQLLDDRPEEPAPGRRSGRRR